MAEGNRKDPRARVLNMTVRYKSATVDEFIENHSHDISRGGIFIKTRAPFPAGTLLKFEVRIAEDQRLMQGVGRVVWRREPERAEDGFPAGMGIKFIKTGEGASELISQIVAARQGEESSFDAGARENGADSGNRRSLPPAEQAIPEVAAISEPAGPSLQVESAPASAVPVEGEIRVSSPPKKRPPPAPERKVVLQGAAVETPTSDKTPISTREVSAQATQERAPNRSGPPARDRSSLVDETTAPRARAITGPSARVLAEREKQSNPSVYGLVAILGVVALIVLFVQLVNEPESGEPPPAPLPPANTAPVAAPPPVVPVPPSPAEPPSAGAESPSPESGEGSEPSAGATPEPAEPAPRGAAAPAPSTAVPAAGAAGVAPKPPVAAPKPGVAAPGATSPGATSPATGPSGATAPGATSPAAPPVATAPAVKPPAPKPPAEPAPAAPPRAVAKPPAPAPAPAPGVAPGAAAPGTAPTAPAGTAGAPSATQRPPAAAAPAEPAPAPKPAVPPAPQPAPSDDNPY